MSTKYAWIAALAVAAFCATGWVWTGDERWGRTMALIPFSLLLLNFVFLPLTRLLKDEK